MTIARKTGPPNHCHFLADARGQMMLEFYSDAGAPIPDYAALHPFAFHIAFQVNDVAGKRDLLLKAGATSAVELKTNADGDQLFIVRDPWGIPLQFVKRTTRMV